MNDSKFNRWFNVFVLGGMVACVIIATVLKSGSGQSSTLLAIAAVGAVAGVLSTVLAANGSIWNFAFGITDIILYSIILYNNDQFAQLGLHLLYMFPMEVVGFFKWRRIGLRKNKVKARRLPRRYWLPVVMLFVVVSAACTVLSVLMLRWKGTGAIPVKLVLDGAIAAANIVALVLMAGAYMEQWYLWMTVNVCSIVLWAITPMFNPDAGYAVVPLIKYIFYFINGLNGIRIWWGLSRTE